MRSLRWDQLWGVLRRRWPAYVRWLLANLGGLITAYVASVTIWVFHNELGYYLPGREAFLITGTISLAVTGISYLSLPVQPSGTLSPTLSVCWAFILALVYGVIIAMGVKPSVRETWIIGLFVGLIFVGSLAWSSITWLGGFSR